MYYLPALLAFVDFVSARCYIPDEIRPKIYHIKTKYSMEEIHV